MNNKDNLDSFAKSSPIYLGQFYINADRENGLKEFFYFQQLTSYALIKSVRQTACCDS